MKRLEKGKSGTNQIAQYGMLIALAFIFSYIESLIPLPIAIPGMKLGLANLVTVIAVYQLDAKAGFVISAIRILLSGLTFSGLFTMLYSMTGGLLSLGVMVLLKKLKCCSIYGVSMAGGASHTVGQILVAAAVLKSRNIFWYLGILLIVGMMTGAVIGIAAEQVLRCFGRREDRKWLQDAVVMGCCLVTGICILCGIPLTQQEGSKVILLKDSKQKGEYLLEENRVIQLKWEDGSYNVLTIQDGKAAMTEASCPDQICVQERAISRTGESIICLPNRVEVRLVGAEEAELDAIAQ